MNSLMEFIWQIIIFLFKKAGDPVSAVTRDLLKNYTEGIQRIYGKSLDAVILYGSYARGDYTEDSDIDIMILVDLSEEEIQKSRDRVSDFTYDFNMDYDLLIMPVVKGMAHFKYWSEAYPFYQNVEKEGVNLNAAS